MIHEQQIQGLILGCTELPLVFNDKSKLSVPYLDTMKIHIHALVDKILEN
jgi:aspartate racemase